MRWAAIALCALGLSGCASLTAAVQPGGLGDKVLQDLKYCKREYQGALGAGLTGSFHIQCDPVTQPVTAQPTAQSSPPV